VPRLQPRKSKRERVCIKLKNAKLSERVITCFRGETSSGRRSQKEKPAEAQYWKKQGKKRLTYNSKKRFLGIGKRLQILEKEEERSGPRKDHPSRGAKFLQEE